MSPVAPGPARGARGRQAQVLTAAALALTGVGVVVAVLEPPWLTGPLHDAVLDAGAVAPVLYVALCMVAAPLHLSGVLTSLAVLIWPLPVAVALSYTGGVLGCVATAALLVHTGTRRARQRDGWPAWLERLSDRVGRRPLLIGIAVRFVLQSGLAVEAFYLLTGYTRGRYLVATTIGFALYLAQAVLGIVALSALVRVSPWLGLLLIVVPIVTMAGVLAARRWRHPARPAGTP